MELTRLDHHRGQLGALYISLSVLGVGWAALVALVCLFLGATQAGPPPGAWRGPDFTSFVSVGFVVAGLSAVLALPGIITGFGLVRRSRWAKGMAVIVGVLSLLNIPFGTVLGAYSLWFWSQPNTDALFGRRG